jgi:hypothetical protein
MWARYMAAVTEREPNAEFPIPPGITYAEIDRTSGGLLTPFCPSGVALREVFKEGTQPSSPCPLHNAAVLTPVVPIYDEFGNLIVTDTAATTSTDTGGFAVPPDSTLTGGVFREQTTTGTMPPAPPPPVTPPPATATSPPEEEREEEPPPATDTSTTTGGPPEHVL